MPAWYDIESLSRSRTLEKCEGIDASKARIGALITKEVIVRRGRAALLPMLFNKYSCRTRYYRRLLLLLPLIILIHL